jgi:hypothetical protein
MHMEKKPGSFTAVFHTSHPRWVRRQCSGSMKFWCGSGTSSGSADQCLELIDPDADPDTSIFITDLQDANKKTNVKKRIFPVYYFLRYLYKIFKDKKMSQNSRNQGFSCYICLMIEGSGCIFLTNRYGSGSPKTRGSGGSGFGSGILS